MKKLLSILTLLLCVCSGAWAEDTELVNIDFTNSAWSGKTFSQGNTTTPDVINSVYFYSKNSDKQFSLANNTSNGLTFPNNNISSGNYYLCIPLTGINGEITVTFVHSYNSSKAKYKYVFIDGREAYQAGNTGGSSGTEVKDANNSDTQCSVTVSATKAKGHLCIGRASGDFTNIKGIIVTTPAPSKTATGEALKTSAAVKVAGTALTKDAATNGYSVSTNTITLSNDILYTSAPSDIKLVKTITYSDESTADDEVDVTFDGTAEDGYYIGTASIGLSGSETEYTVRVKKNTTPTLTATTASITVASPKVATGTQTFTVTGANLAGETVLLSFASAVTGLSVDKTSIAVVDGAVNAEVTVSYKSDEDVAAASVNLTISSTGVSDIVIPVNYSSTAAITTLETVSTKTTWDWSTSGQSSTVNSPISTEYVVFANADGWDESFKANAIAGKASYFYYAKNSTYYTQANGLKINTSTDGTLIVKFNNTGGGSRPYRWLAVQGAVTDYKSKDETKVTAAIPVTSGEILIESIMGTTDASAKPTYTEANAMFNFFEISFIPNVTINLNASGFATYSTDYDFTISGATAYKMALDTENNTLAGTAIEAGTKIKAGEGILLKGEANATVTITPTTGAAALESNDLKGTTLANGTTAEKGSAIYYVLSGNEFKKYTGAAFAENKAYLESATELSSKLSLIFDDDETTSIDSINTQHLTSNTQRYNLAGQKVTESYKGIVIVNGKKYINK